MHSKFALMPRHQHHLFISTN